MVDFQYGNRFQIIPCKVSDFYFLLKGLGGDKAAPAPPSAFHAPHPAGCRKARALSPAAG
jgi:hypothetical protein